MEYAAVFEQLLNCQARAIGDNTLDVVSRETVLQSLRLSIDLTLSQISLKYACAPTSVCELSRSTSRPGSRAFCAGFLAGKGILLLHERKSGHRTLPAKQQRRAMLSISYGALDFVVFIVGFVEALTGLPTRMLYISRNMYAFKVASVVVSLVIHASGVSVVMPYGQIATVAVPAGFLQDGGEFMFSGFGLDRCLVGTCFAVAVHVSEPARRILQTYHSIVYMPAERRRETRHGDVGGEV